MRFAPEQNCGHRLENRLRQSGHCARHGVAALTGCITVRRIDEVLIGRIAGGVCSVTTHATGHGIQRLPLGKVSVIVIPRVGQHLSVALV